MTNRYYRNEYTNRQWRTLIDKANEYNCVITYSKYGTYVTIDSTATETVAIQGNENHRAAIAEHIHSQIQKATDIWIVAPAKYHRGHCQTIVIGKRAAEHEQEKLERQTGFKWHIYADKV